MKTPNQQLTKILAHVEHLRYLAGAHPEEFELCISPVGLDEILAKLEEETDHITDELNRKRIAV